MKPLSCRVNKKKIEVDRVLITDAPANLGEEAKAIIAGFAERIRRAREDKRPVMLSFGAHTIKNGLAPVLIYLIENGWVTHLATNGAGIIHDWEFAYQGETSEDVRANVAKGEFGAWQETGFYINLALLIGAYEGKGYGESVGAMIHHEQLYIPSKEELESTANDNMRDNPERSAGAMDLSAAICAFDLKAGSMKIPHPYKRYSVQAKAFELKAPFTGHPMFGHDIIYMHPLNSGAAIGRAAQRDFLAFVENVSRISGGAYISVGSAIMSPMIFEKAISMSQNLAIQAGRRIEGHSILVVDIAKSNWDWSKGEPPEDSPEYYLRYNKSFSRMGGTMNYLSADNRDFLLALAQELL